MKKIIFLLLLSCFAYGQNVEFTKENFASNKDGLKEIKNRLESGDKFFEQGPMYYKLALYHYLPANQFNPNNALLNYKIGACYLFTSNKLKSIPYLERALKLNPA